MVGAATTLLEPSALSETLVARDPVRVHLVTPAIVERTVARRGVAGLLSEWERQTYAALPVERRRRDWLAGRVAAKRAVRGTCGALGESAPPYAAIEIRNDHDGAPGFAVQGRADLSDHYNISIAHSDGAAVAAIAETAASGSIGVDMEVTKPLALPLLERVLRQSELDRVADDATHPSALVMWTAKEAALKAAHRFCTAVRDVELSWSDGRMLRARVVGTRVPPHAILVRHESAGRYTIALAFCQ